jgi:Mg-chelatase subunit ChlD
MSRLSARSERTLLSARSGGSRHVHVVYQAPSRPDGAKRRPMNLAFVIDRSGSMGGSKLDLARKGTLEGIGRLTPADRFAVVSYDHQAEVVMPSVPGGPESAETARERVASIRNRGSTDLCAGWLTGCKEIAGALADEQVARALLFTDGLANHGETAPEVLIRHATELRSRGIATTTFGIGLDFDEALLRAIADAGGGQARYVEAPADLPRLLREELTDAMDVVHRGAVLRMEGPPSVVLQVVGPWPSRRVGDAVEVTIGDLVSDERLEIVVRALVPAGAEGQSVAVRFSMRDQDDSMGDASADCRWTYAPSPENRAQPRDVAVDRIVASRHAASAREQALMANRRRDYREAARLLNLVAERVESYVNGDRELGHIAASLRDDAQRYAFELSAKDQKDEYHSSTLSSRGRTGTGSASRGTRGG